MTFVSSGSGKSQQNLEYIRSGKYQYRSITFPFFWTTHNTVGIPYHRHLHSLDNADAYSLCPLHSIHTIALVNVVSYFFEISFQLS